MALQFFPTSYPAIYQCIPTNLHHSYFCSLCYFKMFSILYNGLIDEAIRFVSLVMLKHFTNTAKHTDLSGGHPFSVSWTPFQCQLDTFSVSTGHLSVSTGHLFSVNWTPLHCQLDTSSVSQNNRYAPLNENAAQTEQ